MAIMEDPRTIRLRVSKSVGQTPRWLGRSLLTIKYSATVGPYLSLPRGAVARAKRLARSLGPAINDTVINDTIRQLADTWETEEASEGLASFLEKRKPRWVS
jgi:enoyl-CoA hydratase/carnithine racemase